MKRIFTSALIIAFSIGAAQAQTDSTATHQGHKKEHRMAYEKLNLTADQKAQLKSMRQDMKTQMLELKKNNQLSEADRKTRRQELHQQFKSKMEAVLTPEQKDQLVKMRTEWKEKKGKNANFRDGQAFNKNRHTERMQQMQQALDLSKDQQDKMTQIRSSYQKKIQTIHNDASLSQEDKKSHIKELMKQQREEIKTVLTPDQLQKMKSFRKEHAPKESR